MSLRHLIVNFTVALALLHSPCDAQTKIAGERTTEASAADLPVFEPVRSIDLDVPVGLFEVSPDGTEIYIYTEYMTANVWAWLVMIWPRVALLPGLIILFFILRRMIRIARHPEHPGELHCRKCGYLLKTNAPVKCPECGVSLQSKKPRVGRSSFRRYLPFTTTSSLIIGMLFYINITMPRLPESVSNWFHWPSLKLFHLLGESGNGWMELLAPNRHDDSVVWGYDRVMWHHDEIWMIDTSSGKVRRKVQTDKPLSHRALTSMSPSFDWYVYDLAVTRDGRFGFLRSGTAIRQFDLKSGTNVREFVSADGSSQNMMHDMGSEAVKLSAAEKLVFTANGFNEVFAWNVADGQPVDPQIEVIRCVSAPTNPDDPPFYHLWDLADDRRCLFVFTGDPVTSASGAVAKDGQRIFWEDTANQRINVFDVDAATIAEAIEVPKGFTMTNHLMALSPDGRLLAATGSDNQLMSVILLRDLEAGRWVAKLVLPTTLMNHARFSRDGNRLFFSGETSASGNATQHSIFMFDVDAIRKTLGVGSDEIQP